MRTRHAYIGGEKHWQWHIHEIGADDGEYRARKIHIGAQSNLLLDAGRWIYFLVHESLSAIEAHNMVQEWMRMKGTVLIQEMSRGPEHLEFWG